MTKPKTLLINYHQGTNIRPIPAEAENTLQVYPSLGICYLASYLRSHDYPADILDANALGLKEEEFERRVKESAADVVGLTSTTIGWPAVVEASRLVRKALPNAKIIVGGPQVAVFPEECLSFDSFDLGVLGDGEETLLEIIKNIEEGKPIDEIRGTAARDPLGIRINPSRPWIEDISRLPHPAVELLPLDKYHCLTVESPFFTMVSSRGCPYKCAFCSQVYCGEKVRFRTPEDLVGEMENYVKNFGAKEIIMFDETFTIDEKRVLKICDLIKEKGLKFKWNIRTRVDALTEPMLLALKKAGCYGLHLGVESGSPRILELMKKGITVPQIRQAFKMAKKHGFKTRGYFMIGYLDEDLETYTTTIMLAKDLDLDWASFSITTPLPATELFNQAAARKLIDPNYWKKYTLLESNLTDFPVIEGKNWDREMLQELMKTAYHQFYMRPAYIWKRLVSIRSWTEIIDILKGMKVLALIEK